MGLAYLIVALLTAGGVTWALTSVARDEGPLRLRERVCYAVLGVLAGLGWPLVALAALALWLMGEGRPVSVGPR